VCLSVCLSVPVSVSLSLSLSLSLSRCIGLDLLLAGSGSEVLEILTHLADMVDDALDDARAEALTALCNLLEDARALQLLVRSSNAMDDIISGVAFCLGTRFQKSSKPQYSNVAYTTYYTRALTLQFVFCQSPTACAKPLTTRTWRQLQMPLHSSAEC